jgi:hypothetical protein
MRTVTVPNKTIREKLDYALVLAIDKAVAILNMPLDPKSMHYGRVLAAQREVSTAIIELSIKLDALVAFNGGFNYYETQQLKAAFRSRWALPAPGDATAEGQVIDGDSTAPPGRQAQRR